MKNRTIGIWCEHPFQLYSAKPIIDKYRKRGDKIIIYTFKENIRTCSDYTGVPESDIININSLIQPNSSRLTFIYELLFVSSNYSIVYKDRRTSKEKKAHRLISLLTFFLKLPKENVNTYFIRYARLMNYLGVHKNVELQCDMLISLTRVRYPMLLSAIKVPHLSVMESWDHPVKDPYFINPDYNLTWNKSLADDTINYQKLRRVKQIFPLKFRYIFERSKLSDTEVLSSITNEKYLKELAYLKNKDYILYPTTTSSAGIEHEGEMVLINHLCKAAKKAGKWLYIKPKPNGPKGDYDIFSQYSNVIVGLYSTDPDSRDMLDEDYHSFRYLLLRMSDLVVNAGTTFVLEAALTDKKVLQLNLQSDEFGGFEEFTKTEHLKKYILNDKAKVYNGDLDILSEYLQNVNFDYSNSIKGWITEWYEK